MNARRDDLDRLVTEWLHSGASTSGSERVLTATLSRVAVTGQERHATQRVFGDRLGASPQLRWALLAAVLATAVLASVLLAGALRRQPPPPGPATNGWLAFSANGEAGDRLQETNVGRGIGKGDIYVVREGTPAKRIIGNGEDDRHQTCPAFSPDGTMLAYRELDSSAGTATPPPQPSGRAPEAAPPTAVRSPDAGASAAAIIVGSIGRDGTVESTVARITVDATSCLEWSPDGRSLAFLVATASDPGQELRVATLDGQVSRLGPAADLTGDFAWSPDGSTIALQDGGQLWLVPANGSAPRSVASGEFGAVSWSPDGSQLAVGMGATVRVMDIDGTLVADLHVESPGTPPEDERAFAWSPDGRWIAWAEAEAIVRSTSDGAQLLRRPFDVAGVLDLTEPLFPPVPSVLGWSADGERLLVAAGGVDTPGAILAVPWDERASPVVLVEPTFALRGIRASWQEIHE